MNDLLIFTTAAFAAGALITLQASLNATLGSMLGHALWSTLIALAVSLICVVLLLSVLQLSPPSVAQLQQLSLKYWLAGVMSATAIVSLYVLIPKLGVARTMAFYLTGQLCCAVLVAHFSASAEYLGLVQESLSAKKLIGLTAMVVGLVLLN